MGANRAIIFDACWNPAIDVQAIYRIFRFGQKKQIFVYRFAAAGTMESKIYKRQITKQSMSLRAVDRRQIERYFTKTDLHELFDLEATQCNVLPGPPEADPIMTDLFDTHWTLIENYHEHDSLLEDQPDQDLTEEQQQNAWMEFEKEQEKFEAQPEEGVAQVANGTITVEEKIPICQKPLNPSTISSTSGEVHRVISPVFSTIPFTLNPVTSTKPQVEQSNAVSIISKTDHPRNELTQNHNAKFNNSPEVIFLDDDLTECKPLALPNPKQECIIDKVARFSVEFKTDFIKTLKHILLKSKWNITNSLTVDELLQIIEQHIATTELKLFKQVSCYSLQYLDIIG